MWPLGNLFLEDLFSVTGEIGVAGGSGLFGKRVAEKDWDSKESPSTEIKKFDFD